MALTRHFGARTTKGLTALPNLKVTGTAGLSVTLENKRLACRLRRPSASPDVNHLTRRMLSLCQDLPLKRAKSLRWGSRCYARDVTLSAPHSAAPKRARHRPVSIYQ